MYKIYRMFQNPKFMHMAEKTPVTRDRYVDLLRAFSIVVVVIGHWISAVGRIQNGTIVTYNAVGTISGLWILTWIMQVMPLFFFVGGFSNFVTIKSLQKRDLPLSAFYRKRAARLLRPTLIFIIVWAVLLILIALLADDPAMLIKKTMAIIGPLWFLIVYLGIIAVTPLMVWLYRRMHFGTLGILAAAIVLVDIAGFGVGAGWVRWMNVAFVWLFVHQMGFFYADGSLTRLPRPYYIGMAITGLAGLIVLTNTGVYPRSMVGTGLEEISNMNPPTACIAVLAIWLIGLALFLRKPLVRWLTRPRPWLMVIAANSIIMTLFLWHLTAYALVFLLLYPFGLWRAADGSLLWWLMRPVWIILSASVLTLFVGIFGRFER